MRSIRRAAIVGVTTASLVLGTVTVANAAEAAAGASATVSVNAGAETTPKETPKNDSSKKADSSALKGGFKGLSSESNKDKKEPSSEGEGAQKDQTISSVTKGLFQKDSKGNRVTDPKAYSSRIGDILQADQPANGDRLFGSSQDLQKEPKWARALYAVTIASLVGSFLGLVVFPAYNFLIANNIIHR